MKGKFDAQSGKYCEPSDSPDDCRFPDRPVDIFADLRFGCPECVQQCNLVHGRLYTMVGGLIGALAAAVPGLIHLLYYKGGAPPVKKIALTHMTINLTAVVIYAVNI